MPRYEILVLISATSPTVKIQDGEQVIGSVVALTPVDAEKIAREVYPKETAGKTLTVREMKRKGLML